MFAVLILSGVFSSVSANLGVIYARQHGKSEWNDHFCLYYNPRFQELPETVEEAEPYNITDLSSDYGCFNSMAYHKVDVNDTMVFINRGNCTFTEKALMAISHGAAGIIIVSPSLVLPGPNHTSDFSTINITVASIEKKDFRNIMNERNPVEVLLFSPHSSKFDPCVVVIFTLAMFCIIAGGYWSGVSRYQKKEKQVKSKKSKKSEQKKNEKDNENEDDGMDLTIPSIFIFFIAVCTFLVLLYFFYDYLVYVVIGMFCLATAVSTFSVFQPVWNLIPWNTRISLDRVPCCSGSPYMKEICLALVCIGMSVFWAVVRNESYAWIIQDILGVCFCVNMLKTVHMPNLKICIALLVLLFVYDIFFVFITPLFTSTGESVMVKVATGESSSTGEQLPMVFKVPKLGSSPLMVCSMPYSLLGFGDIIIPGLLISYNHGFDIKVKSKRIYFIASTIAYAVGLLITFVALYAMDSGQPALLYLVPCTLLTTFVIGCMRGEVKLLFYGFSSKNSKKDDTPSPSDHASTQEIRSNDPISPETVSISSTSSNENESKTLLRK